VTSPVDGQLGPELLADLIRLREDDDLTHGDIAGRLGLTTREVDRHVWALIQAGTLKPRKGMVQSTRNGPTEDRSWASVRREICKLYEENIDHRSMTVRLRISRTQLQTQLHRLFRESY
jgi:predicted ArsR family transcriptional regulator